MEKIGNRIRIEEEDGNSVFTISAYKEEWKQRLLVIWVLLWSFCGLFVLSRLFADVPSQEKLSYVIFLAFWLYFEYMTVHAALWRAYGVEVLRIDERGLHYARRIGPYERPKHYSIDKVGEVQVHESDERSFSEHFERSYYVIGRMRIEVRCGEKITRLGEKLAEEDARNLVKRIRKELSSLREGGEY